MSDQETHTVSTKMDPRRPAVNPILAAAISHQDEESVEQTVADIAMAMCIMGEIAGVVDVSDYGKMVEAAMPNAKLAATHILATQL